MAYIGITDKSITDYIGIVSLTNGNTTTEYLTGSTLFGICDTAASAQDKIVKIEDFQNFTPTHGLTIHVLFLHTNESNKPDQSYTAENPRLQISSGGTAYPIYQFKGTAAGYTPSTSWRDGAIVPLTFIDARYDDDGSTAEGSNYWIMNSSIDTGADGLASVDLNNVQYADDLKLIEALTGSGYLKRDGTTSSASWSLDNTTFAEAATTLAGYGITDAKIDDGTITLGSNTITPLTAHQTIKQDGITGATINRYGVCSTDANTAAKTVSITTGTMPTLNNDAAGLKVTVKFNNPNTADTPTLNVNSLGAKNIYHKGSQITTGVNKELLAGVCDFIYDGTQWHLVGSYYDTTYSSQTAAQNGTTVSLVTTGEKYNWNQKQNALTFDGTYDASTNKVATESTITNAINALDVDNTNDITGFSNTKTLATLTESNGKIAATFQDIAFPITTVAGVAPTSGTTNIDSSSLLTALGLSSAMHYRGGVDDIPPSSGTYISGDVVTLNSTIKEYVFDGTNWRELGTEGSYKVVQSAVTDPTVSNNETSTSFISNITQDAGGVITPIKKNLPIAAAGTQGIVSIATGDTNILSITDGVLSHKTSEGYNHIPSGGSSGQFLGYSAAGTATWVANPDTHYSTSLVVGGSSAASTATHTAVSSGNVYLRVYDDDSASNSNIQFAAGTNMEITAADTGIITFNNTYSYTLIAATSSVLGGIKIGYSESNSNYAVKLDSESNQAYVTVPWTDTKVTQNILATSIEDTYPLLVSAYKTSENTTTATTVNRVAAIYVKPKDGELHAGKFYGSGANITGITTDHIEGTGNGTKYLRQDGWKVVTVGVNADNTHGVVVTDVGFNQGTFPSLGTTGKAASFQVSGGILTITAGSDATLTDGTLPSLGTISKATLSINGADAQVGELNG